MKGTHVRVAILCTPTCPTAIETMKVLRNAGIDIALVIEERSARTTLSQTERDLRDAHEAFARRMGGAPVGKADFVGRVFLAMPKWVKSIIRRWHHRIPALRRRAVRYHAARAGVEVISVDRHSCRATRDAIEAREIEYVLLCSSSWLLKEPLLSMDARIINTHTGLLPQHRSLDAMGWSILAGDPVGLAAHFVDAGVDTGPVLFFHEVTPQPGDTLISLRRRLQAARPEVFLTACRGLSSGEITPAPQSPDAGEHHRPMTIDELLRAEAALQERFEGGGA